MAETLASQAAEANIPEQDTPQSQPMPQPEQPPDASSMDPEAFSSFPTDELLMGEEYLYDSLKDEGLGFWDYAGDIYTGLNEGVGKAWNETTDLVYEINDYINPWSKTDEAPDWMKFTDSIPPPKTLAGGLASGFSQFATGMVGASKFLKVAGLGEYLTGAGAVNRNAVLNMLASATVFDPHEERLANLLDSIPSVSNALTHYFAADPADTNADGRFKNALEGLFIGTAIDLTVYGAKTLKAWRIAQKAAAAGTKAEQDAAIKGLAKATEEYDAAVEKYKVEHEGEPDYKPFPPETPKGDTGPDITIDAAPGKVDVTVHPKSPPSAPSYAFQPLSDTNKVGGKTFYHGTAKDYNITDYDVYGMSNPYNLYGDGLYLTDNKEVAKSYALKNKNTAQGFLHSVEMKDLNLVDLEHPLPEDVAKVLKTNLQEFDVPEDEIADILTKPGKNVYKKLQDAMEAEGLTTSDAQEITTDIGHNLSQLGYDGFNHIGQGGKAFNKDFGKHNVAILFEDAGVNTKTGQLEGRLLKDKFTPLGQETVLKDELKNPFDIIYSHRDKPQSYTDAAVSDYFDKLKSLDEADPDELAYLIRPDKMTSEADVKRTMASLVDGTKRIKDPSGAPVVPTGSKPLEVTLDNAKRLYLTQFADDNGLPTDAAIGVLKDGAAAWNCTLDEYATAVRFGQEALASQIKKWGAYARHNTLTPEENTYVFELLRKYEVWNAYAKGGSTEAGRTVSSYRINIADSVKDMGFSNKPLTRKEVVALKEQMGGDPAVAHLVEAVAAIGDDTKALNRFAQKSLWGKGVEVITSLFVNSILSGLGTNATNLGMNSVKALYMPSQRILGGIISGDKAAVKQGFHLYAGLVRYFQDSFKMMAKAATKDTNILDVSEKAVEYLDHPIKAAMPKPTRWIGSVIEAPTKGLMLGDEFFKQLNFRAHAYSEMMKEAVDGGLSPKEAMDHIKAHLDNAFTASGKGTDLLGSLSYSRDATWTNSLDYGIGFHMQRMFNSTPALKLFVPFIRIGDNLIRETWQHTPLVGMFQRQLKADLAAGGVRRQTALAKQMAGLGLYMLGYHLVSNGMITGSASSDYRERQLKAAQKWQPESIRIKQDDGTYKFYPIGRMDPYASPLIIMADLFSIARSMGEDSPEYQQAASIFMAAVVKNFSQKGYMRGVADMVRMLSDDDTTHKKINAWARKTGRAVVLPLSNLFGDIRSWDDPYMREARGFVDSVLNKLPEFSESLPKKYNWINGKPIQVQHWGDTGEDNAVINEMVRLNYKFTPPPYTTQEGVELTPEQHSEFSRLHGSLTIGGKNLEQALKAIMLSPEYDFYRKVVPDSPPGQPSMRVKMIQEEIGVYRQYAREKLFDKYPELRQEVDRAKWLKGAYKSGDTKAIEILNNLKEN